MESQLTQEIKKIKSDILKLEKAGCFAIVIECVDEVIAQLLTQKCRIPIIGIGAGDSCDGQIMVTDDLLGLTDTKIKFVKKYADLKGSVKNAVKKFKLDVKKVDFPLQVIPPNVRRVLREYIEGDSL